MMYGLDLFYTPPYQLLDSIFDLCYFSAWPYLGLGKYIL